MNPHRCLLLCALLSSFAAAQTPPFAVLDGSLPYGTLPDAVGDVDNDGDQDAVGNGFAWINDGHARFTTVTVPSLAFSRMRAILADLNGDGFPDLVSLDASNAIRIDLGFPGLAFATPVTPLPAIVPTGAIVNVYTTGDVDNDGDLDILLATTNWIGGGGLPSQANLWLNNGAATFTAAPPGSVPATPLSGPFIALRDLDADGDLDAVFAGAAMMPEIQVLLNSGGTFATAPQWQWPAPTISALEIGSFNGDAFPDLIFSGGAPGSTSIITGSATGFAAGGSAVNGLFNYLRTVDVNGDGIDEVVAHGGGLTLHQVSGSPPALGPAIQSWPTSELLIGSVHDLDADGDRDLFAIDAFQPLLLMNQGNGSLLRLPGRTAGFGYLGTALTGDLDGDQDPDIFGFLNAGFTIGTAMNDGDGYFVPGPGAPITLPATSPYYYSLFAFDRDGDGDPDVYAARNNLTAFTTAPYDVVFDRTAGTFVQSMTVSGTGDTAVFKAADLDGDGDQDILLGRRHATTISNGLTGPMLLLRNLGAAGLAPPVPIGGNHSTYDLEVADFDGNGMLDVFQVNRIPMGADPCVLYLNVGGTYTALTQGFSGYWSAAGDLNADGMADLIVDGQMLFASGGGNFIPGAPLPSPIYAPAMLADLDLDGDLDLFESQGTVMLNGGGGVFGPPISYRPRGGSSQPILADVDRDGDPDAINGGPVVLMNTTRQIAHGSIARPGRPASIDLYGTAGGAWFLWASNGTNTLPFPPWGTVLIDPASAQLGAMGQFAGSTAPLPGTASFGVTVPNNPALVGWTTFWQAIDATQMRFTNRLTITVLNY